MLFAMSQKELNRVDVIRDVCEKRLTQVNGVLCPSMAFQAEKVMVMTIPARARNINGLS